MKTIQETAYQTVEAMIRRHDELAAFYVEKAGAAALAAGALGSPSNSSTHSAAASAFYHEATEQRKKAEGLKAFLSSRRAEEAAPAIERGK